MYGIGKVCERICEKYCGNYFIPAMIVLEMIEELDEVRYVG
ncbi:MAG: hypothetical protein QW079_00885 [Nitrososphaerota archaeon]